MPSPNEATQVCSTNGTDSQDLRVDTMGVCFPHMRCKHHLMKTTLQLILTVPL
jgi:hypothetical protein